MTAVEGRSPPDTGTQPSSRFGAARLYRDAAALASSYVVNAVAGMVFWAVAAHLVPPDRLGVMTAVLAAITAPSLVLAAGIGDAYTSLMPAVGRARPAVYRRGQRVYLVVSALSGIVGGVATISLISEVRSSVVVAVLVAVGTVAVAGFTLQTSTLVAIGRARWMMAVNAAVGLLRIVLLVAFAMSFVWHCVELAFVLSAALVMLTLRPLIARIIDGADELPDDATFTDEQSTSEFDRFVVRTIIAVALSLGILTITPFLVTAFGGPREGALFALSLSIVQTLDFVGTALGVSLVVHASNAPETAERMARSILLKALALAVVGAAGIVTLAPGLLRMLNPQYGEMDATGVLAALCAASVVRTFYMVWAALQRSRRRMRALLILNACATVTVLSTLPWLTESHGAFGGAVSVLLAQGLLSLGAAVHFVFTRSTAVERQVDGH